MSMGRRTRDHSHAEAHFAERVKAKNSIRAPSKLVIPTESMEWPFFEMFKMTTFRFFNSIMPFQRAKHIQ